MIFLLLVRWLRLIIGSFIFEVWMVGLLLVDFGKEFLKMDEKWVLKGG